LATELAGASAFEALSLFSDKSADRMNDIDFVSELMALLSFGFTDKKEKVDVLYASDISEAQYRDLKQRFEAALARIAKLDAIVPVNRTRFKQKGDFYTLFGFIANNPNLALKALEHIYNILLRLSPHIRPSQENCDPLLEYAVNCVTQSNSKKARESRNKLFDELFLNSSDQPNATQDAVAEYFALKSSDYEKVSSYLVFRLEALDRSIPD
jgi:hypothetical protein